MNKREQQRLIREQKQQQAEKQAKLRKTISRLAMVIVIPLVIISVIYGLMFIQGRISYIYYFQGP